MLWVGTSWKMNGTLKFAREYAEGLSEAREANLPGIQPFVIPPLTAIDTFKRGLSPDSRILVGAQDAQWEKAGAWTGEVSVEQVADAVTEFDGRCGTVVPALAAGRVVLTGATGRRQDHRTVGLRI